MIAGDYTESSSCARLLYDCIRAPLVSTRVSSDRKLPLVYVLDSILKNAGSIFQQIMENDIKNWMPIVYKHLHKNKTSQQKLKKVWKTWKEFNLFTDTNWKQMGTCFLQEEEEQQQQSNNSNSGASPSGGVIERTVCDKKNSFSGWLLVVLCSAALTFCRFSIFFSPPLFISPLFRFFCSLVSPCLTPLFKNLNRYHNIL